MKTMESIFLQKNSAIDIGTCMHLQHGWALEFKKNALYWNNNIIKHKWKINKMTFMSVSEQDVSP